MKAELDLIKLKVADLGEELTEEVERQNHRINDHLELHGERLALIMKKLDIEDGR